MTHLRAAGLVQFLLAFAVVAVLVFFPFSRFVLPILVPLAILYALTGYWLVRGRLRKKAVVAVPAILVIFFVVNQLPASVRLIRDGDLRGWRLATDLAINGGLLALNGYVLWALLAPRTRVHSEG